jgi:hypothetical protein
MLQVATTVVARLGEPTATKVAVAEPARFVSPMAPASQSPVVAVAAVAGRAVPVDPVVA